MKHRGRLSKTVEYAPLKSKDGTESKFRRKKNALCRQKSFEIEVENLEMMESLAQNKRPYREIGRSET